MMTFIELELLHKFRNSDDPEKALQIATEIILDHLKQLESSHTQSEAPMQEACVAI